VVTSIVVVGSWLRLVMLTHQSLWWDEGYSLYYSGTDSIQATFHRLASTNSSERFQPLYFLILNIWRNIFGDSVSSLRLLSVLFGSAFLVVTYRLAIRLYDRSHAIWALLAAAFSAYAVYYSQETRPYALLMLLSALHLLAFVKCALSPERRTIYKVWFWLTCAVGWFGSIFLVLFSAAICAGDLAVRKQWKSLLTLWLPGALVAIPSLLYQGMVSLNPGAPTVSMLQSSVLKNLVFVPYGLLVGSTYGPPAQALRGPDVMRVLLSRLPELALFLGIVLALSAVVVLAWRRCKWTERETYANRLLFLALVFGFIFSWLFTMATKLNWQPRHSFFLMVPALLLIPIGARMAFAGRAVLIAFMGLNVWSLVNYFFDPRHGRDDVRGTVRHVMASRGHGIASVVLGGEITVWRYYGDAESPFIDDIDLGTLAERVAKSTGSSPEVLLAVCREFFIDPQNRGLVAEAMSPRYDLLGKTRFQNFIVYRLSLKPKSP
jgi:hypothetical protein